MLNLNKENPSGDWSAYIPTDHDVQVSHIADMMACGAYSLVHKAEIRMKFLTGRFWEISERAQAKLSGTTTEGNSLENEIKAATDIGLILAKDWPELLYSPDYPNVTWNDYYQTIPEAVQKKAYKFELTPLQQLYTPAQITAELKIDTTWVIIKTSGENHIVVRLNQYGGKWGMGQYYDSYEIVVKDFQPSQPILSEWSLTLTPKLMTNARLVQFGTEWGFYIPSSSGATLLDMSLNLGYPLPTINNGSAVDWANVKPDLIATSNP